MRLADLVAATDAVGATTARKEKVAILADVLRTATPEEMEIVVGLIAGDPRQGRIGVGWATVAGLEVSPTDEAVHDVTDLDRLLTDVAATSGAGSKARREELLRAFLEQATGAEVDFVRRLLVGELRQGANAGIATDAIAKGTDVPAAVLRRAAMLTGDLRVAARIAAAEGRKGLDAIGLELGRPVSPMLASTSASVAAAVEELGRVAVEWKLDGIRIQVHKHGDDVRIWTRGLNEISIPGVVERVRSFPADSLVLDGEVLGIHEDGTPVDFQDTVAREAAVTPFFFDVLHVDGRDLLDTPLEERRAELARVAGDAHVPGEIVDDIAAAEAVQAAALDLRHEGVMVKAADSTYQAGRRGKTWRKVKPVHTLDLVVLAVEYGSGRRQGWLSNIHLGARDPETGGLVMVGKTFKGMTDEMLRWQTERFRELEVDDDGWLVRLRPEQVVEIAIDGIQRSTRYPGGVALRFARVVRYRDDKSPSDANTIDDVRSVRG
ncbi:MAG: ATP-dependent DNA ligase, partial [Actinomycetota bacterium]